MQQQPLKRFKRLAVEIDAENRNQSSSTSSGNRSTVEDELTAYFSAYKYYTESTGLNFWVKSEGTFPLLAPLAQDIISAPASEAYVERGFRFVET